MIEPGDILETYIQLGNIIYGYEILAINAKPEPSALYNFKDAYCPSCDSINTCCINKYYSDDGLYGFGGHYCQDCKVIWQLILIGEAP